MALIRRKWTPAAADEWTREDWIAIVLSPLAYIALAVGVTLSILMLKVGFIILGAAVMLTGGGSFRHLHRPSGRPASPS